MVTLLTSLPSLFATRKPSESAISPCNRGTRHNPKLTPLQVLPGAAQGERARGYICPQWEGLEDLLTFAKGTGSHGFRFRELEHEV